MHKETSIEEPKPSSMENIPNIQVPIAYLNGKPAKKDLHFSYAMQLVRSASLPMVLYAAVKLKLFEIIAEAGHVEKLSSAQIASQLPTRNPNAASMLDRVLLLLSSYSVLTCDVLQVAGDGDDDVKHERVYGLSPVGEYFLEDKEGGSVGPLLEMLQDKLFLDSWYELPNAVLEGGIPFNRAHGMNTFDYISRDSRVNELFNKGMAGLTSILMKQLLIEYKGFEHIHTLVDVGGGNGTTLYNITSKYPSIKGINFDLPHVIKRAPSYPGVEHVGGDMFESVPKGDAIFLKKILHDWSDEDCIKLLKNCFEAVPSNGKVIVVDYILPLKPDSSTFSKDIYQTDVVMMTQTTGGKERSAHELRALAIRAGFRGIRSECRPGNLTVVEIYK